MNIKNLSKTQQKALDTAIRGEWLFPHDLFPHWIHRREWTAERLWALGFLERRSNGNWSYEYRVKE